MKSSNNNNLYLQQSAEKDNK